MRVWVFTLLLVSVFGCTQDVQTDPEPMDSVYKVPEHLQDIENLTVLSPDQIPEFDLQLSRDQVFPETEDIVVGEILGMTVDASGRLFIVDGSQSTVHIFGEDGEYVTNIGRSGRGPGEFESFALQSSIFTHSNDLYVYDAGLRRINVFSLETFESSGTVNLRPEDVNRIEGVQNATPILHSVRSDGSFIMTFDSGLTAQSSQYFYYFILDSLGHVSDPETPLFKGKIEPLVPLRPTMSFPLFFSRRTMVDISNDDFIYSVWSEEFLIKVYDPEGNYLRAFYYPFTNRDLTRESAIERVSESSRTAVRSFENLPDTWPAIYSLQLDDMNRIWVATITDDDDTYTYWVLNSEGELLAVFDLPKVQTRFLNELQIQFIHNDYLYIRETDEQTGLQQIVRYRIEMENM